MNLILSTYFVTKPDPQRGHYWKGNDFSIIETWYNSVMKFNLNAVVFHDHLSQEFIDKYENENIKFIYSGLVERLSCNDERFFIFASYLRFAAIKPDNVLITDISDVEFLRNPFKLIKKANTLYIGSNDTWAKKPNVRKKYSFLNDEKYDNVPVYHAGTFGGPTKIMFTILAKYCDIVREELGWYGGFNQNLGIINRIVEELDQSLTCRVEHGQPFVTKFKKYQTKNRTCFIRHK